MGTVTTEDANLPAPDGDDGLRNGDNQIRALAAALDSRVHHSGDLKATARSSAPTGWLLCDGAAVSRTTYADLFDAIGTTYGAGNGTTTFNLPDLRARAPIGVDGSAGRLAADDALGAASGSATHTLTDAEMPEHTHALNLRVSGSGLGVTNPGLADGGSFLSSEGYTVGAGGDQAHNNMPPYQVVNWLVKT